MKSKLLLTLLLAFIGLSNNASAQYTKLYDFGVPPDGNQPYGSLYSDGTFMYGMTLQGGLNQNGVIFKIKPDGSDYTVIYEFQSADFVFGSLISDGTFLYGMTQNGGINGVGSIFKIMPDGTAYSDIFSLGGFSSQTGVFPLGTLYFDGTFLYGMTTGGGTGGGKEVDENGTIFKIKPDGTGYDQLHNFTGAPDGDDPFGDLISDGTFLYGMTKKGGANGDGTIFKIKPNGTGYLKLLDFSGAENGSNPCGSLIFDGTFLYGMTEVGGVNDTTNGGDGVIFKIKPDGTGYLKLQEFSGVANGSMPLGSLFSDGTFLYGMTELGGAIGFGVLFKLKPDGTEFDTLMSFTGVNGLYPAYGSLISDGTFLYGMTAAGGISGNGVIFKYDLLTSVNEFKNELAFSIYPNPATKQLTIHTSSLHDETATALIMNMIGETMHEEKLKLSNDISININNLASGMYFIQMKSENGSVVKKFIKE